MADYDETLGEAPENILVVVDPTQDDQPALTRVVETVKRLGTDVSIHLFIGIDGSGVDFKATSWSVYRDLDWFYKLVEPLEQADIKYTSAISWSHQWQESILYTADYYQSQMIYLSDYSGNGKPLSNAGWTLLRYSSCPVLIVRDGAEPHRKSVLAAINGQNRDPVYQELKEKIVSVAQWIANAYNAEMHLVNAYEDSLDYPDRSKLLKETGLPNECIHITYGEPKDAIAEVADKVEASIVVIGTRNRRGISAMMNGNTSEKVIAKVKQDVIVLN